MSCDVRGAVDIALLERAAQLVVERHPALRAIVVAAGVARPLVVVRTEVKSAFAVCDARALSDAAPGAPGGPTPPVGWPAVRVVVTRTGDDTHVISITCRASALDEPSAARVFTDMLAIYGELRGGGAAGSAPAPSYATFLAWLRGRDLARAEAFWRGLLAGRVEQTSLVIERGAAEGVGRRQDEGRREVALSLDDTAGLLALSEQSGVALSTIIEGAWALLLSRYNDDDDVVFGVRVSGRPAAVTGSDAMVGCFALILPLRVKVDDRATARAWLNDLDAVRRAMEEHQHVSPATINAWLGLPPEYALFKSVVSMTSADALMSADSSTPLGSIGGAHVGPLRASWDGDHVFELRARLDARRLHLMAIFDQSRLDTDDVAHLLAGVQTLLADIARDPSRPLAAARILDDRTLQNLLVDWNGPQPGYRESPTIHGLFEDQARRTPDVIAVAYKDRALTYRELDRQANQLAAYLRKLGVGPEVLVANCVERSIEMVIGILGILKAGGAYVPVDPSYPVDRLAFMLEDAKASVVLTLDRHVGNLPSSAGHVVCLDTDWELISKNSDEHVPAGSTGDNLSYVIYTSGSTGRPKGVMVRHRGVCSSSEYYARIIAMPPGSRMLQITSVGFDMCVFDVVPALTSGLTLVLADPEPPLGIDLLRTLQESKIEIISFPPSILATLPIVPLPMLKFIGVAGEAVSAELVARWAPGRRFYNAYGPAEGSVWCAGNFLDGSRPPVFGRAIDNVKIYLIDKRRRLVPVGVPGELCIGGDVQVSRGYLRRPGLTADRFIPDPFHATPGARLYRTGDLARYLPDGNLEFLGRTDHQVKIRGFRVELGEVEAVLGHHPDVREAIVVVRESAHDGATDKRLFAYILPHDGTKPSTSELRAFVAQKLPDNMVPAAFVIMDQFPLTPNGKVDRAALPEPDASRPDLKEAYVAPRTPIEEVMVEIWTNVLGIQEVGVEDNFFELGGHSLLATQIVSRVRDVFQVDLPLTTIFQTPRIAELASLTERMLDAQQKSEAES